MTSKAISRWRDKRRQTAQGKINKKIGDNTIFEASIIIVGNLRVVTKELSQDYQNFKVIAANCTMDGGTNSTNNESDIRHYLHSRRVAVWEGDVRQRCSNRGSSAGAGSSSSGSGSRVGWSVVSGMPDIKIPQTLPFHVPGQPLRCPMPSVLLITPSCPFSVISFHSSVYPHVPSLPHFLLVLVAHRYFILLRVSPGEYFGIRAENQVARISYLAI